MDNFHIRRATLGDQKLLATLTTTTFYEAYFELDDPSDLSSYIVNTFNVSVVESELSGFNSTYFLATLNDKAIGYANLHENSTVECIQEENVIELQRIYILQKMLGKGFGEKLLNHCLEAAAQKGYQFIWLSVWEQNLPAQNFYKKQGFVNVGDLQYPYGATITRNLVMLKSLS